MSLSLAGTSSTNHIEQLTSELRSAVDSGDNDTAIRIIQSMTNEIKSIQFPKLSSLEEVAIDPESFIAAVKLFAENIINNLNPQTDSEDIAKVKAVLGFLVEEYQLAQRLDESAVSAKKFYDRKGVEIDVLRVFAGTTIGVLLDSLMKNIGINDSNGVSSMIVGLVALIIFHRRGNHTNTKAYSEINLPDGIDFNRARELLLAALQNTNEVFSDEALRRYLSLFDNTFQSDKNNAEIEKFYDLYKSLVSAAVNADKVFRIMAHSNDSHVHVQTLILSIATAMFSFASASAINSGSENTRMNVIIIGIILTMTITRLMTEPPTKDNISEG